jgi:hypothetical protein
VAIEDFASFSCIRFVPKTDTDVNYIKITQGGGCYSNLGMSGMNLKIEINYKQNPIQTGGEQIVSIDTSGGCFAKGIIIHELLHTLGFHHEQGRPDRDSFVQINAGNLSDPNWISLDIHTHTSL